MDERATLANMATECSARTAIIEADEKTFAWIAAMRPGVDIEALRERAVAPDPDAEYAGGVHTIDLSQIRPMVAHPGDPDRGIPSDPTNGAFVEDVEDVKIDIAYAGSCTAGKIDDFLFYHQVAKEAVDAGLKVAEGVKFYIQFGSQAVETFARENGLLDTFERAGAVVLNPGCGACIGCGPGVSEESGSGHDQRDQPQLQRPLRPRQVVAGLAADRRRLGVHRVTSPRTRRGCSRRNWWVQRLPTSRRWD